MIISLIPSIYAFATHERAGEITYKCLGGNTYEITVTTYSKGTNDPADRCFLNLNLEDDTVAYVICRSNYEPGDPTADPWGASCIAMPECATHHMGEWSMFPYCLDTKKNVYLITHTFPGPGTYIISCTDPNRVDGIINIPNNQTAMRLQDTLVINPFFNPCNSSPLFLNYGVDTAMSGICRIYDCGAVDPDGDSLSYALVPPKDDSGAVAGYWFPPGTSINPITGDFTWCSPPYLAPPGIAPFNFAIGISEWRKIGSTLYKIGTVLREIEIIVNQCNPSAGINEMTNDEAFTVSPNPSSDFITLQTIKTPLGSYNAALYDFTGKMVFQKSSIEEKNYSISTLEFNNGIYLLMATAGDKNMFAKKIMIRH